MLILPLSLLLPQCKHSLRCSRVKWLFPWQQYGLHQPLPSSFPLWPHLFLSRMELRQEARSVSWRTWRHWHENLTVVNREHTTGSALFINVFFCYIVFMVPSFHVSPDHPDRTHAHGSVPAASRRSCPPRQPLPCNSGHSCCGGASVSTLPGCATAASTYQVQNKRARANAYGSYSSWTYTTDLLTCSFTTWTLFKKKKTDTKKNNMSNSSFKWLRALYFVLSWKTSPQN